MGYGLRLKLKSYRDLAVYRRAHEVAVRIHEFTLRLPKYELYETGSQLRRSSKAISANIVEGFGRRRYRADYIRFLVYSHSSCDESIEWVTYIRDCHPDRAEWASQLLAELDEIGRMLNRFIASLER